MDRVYKTWAVRFAVITILMLSAIGMTTIVVDPYFHYHKPLKSLQYRIYNERYQNDGIIKHFDYDALITGTSLTENFKTSELDRLFGVHSIKVPFAGASYREINNNLVTAMEYNPGLKMVVRGLDYDMILREADVMRFELDSYPQYLYNRNVLDDARYILNKEILFNDTIYDLYYTKNGYQTTTFDAYNNWNARCTFDEKAVKDAYSRVAKQDSAGDLSVKERKIIKKNITENVIELADANPEVEFYLFFTPYSILCFDAANQHGTLLKTLETEKYAIELMLEYPNIHLFSFFDVYDMICDLDNYKDPIHYGEWINSQILKWMKAGEHELTQENYEQYCERTRRFYVNYDYDRLFTE